MTVYVKHPDTGKWIDLLYCHPMDIWDDDPNREWEIRVEPNEPLDFRDFMPSDRPRYTPPTTDQAT